MHIYIYIYRAAFFFHLEMSFLPPRTTPGLKGLPMTENPGVHLAATGNPSIHATQSGTHDVTETLKGNPSQIRKGYHDSHSRSTAAIGRVT